MHPLTSRTLPRSCGTVFRSADGHETELGRVDDWRGGGRPWGRLVRRRSPVAGASLPAVAPSPVSAVQRQSADLGVKKEQFQVPPPKLRRARWGVMANTGHTGPAKPDVWTGHNGGPLQANEASGRMIPSGLQTTVLRGEGEQMPRFGHNFRHLAFLEERSSRAALLAVALGILLRLLPRPISCWPHRGFPASTCT